MKKEKNWTKEEALIWAKQFVIKDIVKEFELLEKDNDAGCYDDAILKHQKLADYINKLPITHELFEKQVELTVEFGGIESEIVSREIIIDFVLDEKTMVYSYSIGVFDLEMWLEQEIALIDYYMHHKIERYEELELN